MLRALRADRTIVVTAASHACEPGAAGTIVRSDGAPTPPPGVSICAANAILYSQNEPARAIYVLLSGRVRLIKRSPLGLAACTGLLRAGDIFGIDGLSCARHAETAHAGTSCAVCTLSLAAVDRLIARQPGFAAIVLRALVRRRAAAERLLVRALIVGAPGRVAAALIDAAEAGTVAGLPRQWLADAAWTARETASRTLSRFAAEGLIRIDGQTIELLGMDRLQKLAVGSDWLGAA